MHRTVRVALALAVAPAMSPAVAAAQADAEVAFGRCGVGVLPLQLPGGIADDDARITALARRTGWSLMRRTTDAARAVMAADTSRARVRVSLVAPEVLVTSQSAFPLPANDGPLWAGRGVSHSVTGGVATCGARGRWGVIVAPTFWRSENRDVALVDDPRIVPPFKPDANPFSSPYHYDPRSLDAPRRFGPDGVTRWEAGTIAAWWRSDRVEVGVTTESEWWGPGLRNALLLSSQASGVPRGYVRTAAPLRVAGELDAQLFLGRLSWSPWFRVPTPPDSARTLSGLGLVWRPWFEPRLQLGLMRLVAAPVTSGELIGRAFDAVRSVGRPNAVSIFDSTAVRAPDQLIGVSAHWQLPDDATELWLEWARAEQPASLTDLLAAPNHSRALTIGVQHARALPVRDWTVRLAFEYSATNQTGTFRERPSGSWYTSRSVPGGFTQRGQVLGAMIGPGSVTQWGAVDVASRRGLVGVFVQRIKWDDDSFYTIPRPLGNGLCKHDVSLAWGLRGLFRSAHAGELEASVASQQRLNLYWQALGFCFANEELQVDRRNLTLSFRWRPPVGRR